MAKQDEEKKDAPSAARDAAKEAATDVAEDTPTYDHDWLISAAGSFGFQPAEVAGALSAVSKKNLTIDEAKATTAEWLKSPVKTED